jgi:hypothetical protein
MSKSRNCAALALSCESPDVILTHSMQAGLRVDLRRADSLVPEELLHLIQRHARIQQNSRDARSQPVWGHFLVNMAIFAQRPKR